MLDNIIGKLERIVDNNTRITEYRLESLQDSLDDQYGRTAARIGESAELDRAFSRGNDLLEYIGQHMLVEDDDAGAYYRSTLGVCADNADTMVRYYGECA